MLPLCHAPQMVIMACNNMDICLVNPLWLFFLETHHAESVSGVCKALFVDASCVSLQHPNDLLISQLQ
jgi:hypothetical protein